MEGQKSMKSTKIVAIEKGTQQFVSVQFHLFSAWPWNYVVEINIGRLAALYNSWTLLLQQSTCFIRVVAL